MFLCLTLSSPRLSELLGGSGAYCKKAKILVLLDREGSLFFALLDDCANFGTHSREHFSHIISCVPRVDTKAMPFQV